MESNYGGSESNYGYGGVASESNYSSESHDTYKLTSSYSGESSYESSYGGFASESSYSSESHNTYKQTPSYSGESAHESRSDSLQAHLTRKKVKKYNSLDDIDKLIEDLEASMKNVDLTSDRANQVLAQRQKKIVKLKKIVADARKAEEEKRILDKLKRENNELDDAIDILTKGLRNGKHI